MGELTLPDVKANFEQRSTSGEFQSVAGQKHETGRQFTTRETVAAELATIGHMKQGQNTVEPIMRIDDAQKQAETREFLNPSQQSAIQDVLTSHDRVQGIQGLAGTGKTTTLASIREGAEKNGYAVEGSLLPAEPAQQLRDAGISADTLQGFLGRGGQQQMAGDPDRRHLYMVDESSLASTRQMQAFMEKIGPQDRVLLIGDIRQHQGVDAGKPFEQMQQAGMRTALLDTIVRQKGPGAASRGRALIQKRDLYRSRSPATGRDASRRYRTTPAASPRLPRTMQRDLRTLWSSLQTTRVGVTSMKPSEQSCRTWASYRKTAARWTC